jgi:septum site-determining protein MinD
MWEKFWLLLRGKVVWGKPPPLPTWARAWPWRARKVVLIDADIGLRNLDVVMGLENRIVFDLVDVVENRCRLKQALIRDKRYEGLFLLPASQAKDKTAVQPEQMKELCESLQKDNDYVIVDCPAGIEQGFKNAIAGADSAIVITTPEVSAVRDADRIIGLLEAAEISSQRLIINRIRPEMVQRGDMMDIGDVQEILAIELLGVVPDDERIIVSTNKGEPIVTQGSSLAGQAFLNISRRIMGEQVPFLELTKPEGLLQRLKKIMGIGSRARHENQRNL